MLDGSEEFLVLGVGASAGGLEACRELLEALKPDRSIAILIVQHLDPTQDSMLVELLASHTNLVVLDVIEGMTIAPGHCYVLPPGSFLSVGHNMLHLSKPLARRGSRLPFDFLLHTLAQAYGSRAVSIVLSGTGADGSAGIRDIREQGGYVIVQDPAEAQYDGMPRSAIATGLVDAVLRIKAIPDAVAARSALPSAARRAAIKSDEPFRLIIELLRNRTSHDFTLYKHGTLRRRMEQRIARLGMQRGNLGAYHDLLAINPLEVESLAQDLLINVTRFFRDPAVFETVRTMIIPELMAVRTESQPVRIWSAGCSTGEETYSLAILFQEWAEANNSQTKVQIFASDVDPDAIARAREGLYSDAIEADVSGERLARHFTREDRYYRINRDLRGLIIFTVHDLLADPPFSNLDMIACRNMMIYLRPEAQNKLITQFRFALREGGVLLLGSAENLGQTDQTFEVISKTERLFRRIGRSRPTGAIVPISKVTSQRLHRNSVSSNALTPMPRQAGVAELCRRLVIEAFSPAAVLINRKFEYLYSLGPTERYLRVAPGLPSLDLIAMTRPGVRTTLRSAVQRSIETNARVIAPGGTVNEDNRLIEFQIDVQPIVYEGEALFLICFIEEQNKTARTQKTPVGRNKHLAAVERELAVTRTELQGAIRDLEQSGEDQAVINEEALSVNEEFMSTNEELMTSKEELQSLNEELTALNSQLQETLERQRTTGNDLQNILYSTDIATLFLDIELNIRFFTPATRNLFKIIASDIGRPLSDLTMLADDESLGRDIQSVLLNFAPVEQEILTDSGVWLIRRITSYRTQEDRIEGVVITFVDITERKAAAQAVDDARRSADSANSAKSRFLASASHDLRQPLQMLSLLQGLLARTVTDQAALKLVGRFEQTVEAMNGMLNTLLDINQIEAGVVQVDIGDVALGPLFARIHADFGYQAEAAGVRLRVVQSDLSVRTDPVLIEQIIRNLVSNAIKYARSGGVLLGCRRHSDLVTLQVWDSGVGIAADQIDKIFEEYLQLDNPARERSRGLGLGLSIVKRLVDLLNHTLDVRSIPGKGTVFSIGVPRGNNSAQPATEIMPAPVRRGLTGRSVLVIEDDPELRDLLAMTLARHGVLVSLATDAPTAFALMTQAGLVPDLILTDYNLPHGMNGVEVAKAISDLVHMPVPVLVLTGDISTATMRNISTHGYAQLSKPVSETYLVSALSNSLHENTRGNLESSATTALIGIIEDNEQVQADFAQLLQNVGFNVVGYPSAEAFIAATGSCGAPDCLIIDAGLTGMSGIDLLDHLRIQGSGIPTLIITGDTDITTAVAAIRAGAADFVTKPVATHDLLDRINYVIAHPKDQFTRDRARDAARIKLNTLSKRQTDVLARVLSGHASKTIANDLGISSRTVEAHRAAIMKKLGATSLPAITRLAIAAEWVHSAN